MNHSRSMHKALTLLLLSLAAPAAAQSGAAQVPAIVLPTVVVTAQKEPADRQTLPLSVTAVTTDMLSGSGISWVSEAGVYSPNTFFSELSARKISNVRFRGIGSSPANPGITTFIDGVPQLNTNSASAEFVEVDQVEFVRGPQSSLFGRNTLGGLINITSSRPATAGWTGGVSLPSLGNFGARDVRASVSGPITPRLAMSAAIGRSVRDGYTVNDLTGHTIDDRAATMAKGQILWTPTDRWEARAIISGERARDGDYPLNDLGQLRSNPFHVSRDFEGSTSRDLMSYSLLTRREGTRLAFSTTTGVVRWKTADITDLDYTPLPLITRGNDEKSAQFTQEVRLASAANAPVRLSDRASLRWQTGVFLFTQNYEQDAINSFSPGVLSPFLLFPVQQHSPQSDLDDVGIGLFGQGTVTLAESLDVTVGLRVDRENKDATLDTFFEPVISAPRQVVAEESFSSVSPQTSVAYRLAPGRMVYGSAGRGFKAGGFNPASPAGSESYGQERTWNFEGGLKTTLADGRVSANASVFHINWNDLQLNLPNLQVPGEFYIANVGGAHSTGLEVEVAARPRAAVDLFATLGVTHARFTEGSISSGVAVSGNRIPSTPDFTGSIGAQVTRDLAARATVYGRADAVLYGTYKYDDLNQQGQDAYSIANLRAGVRTARPAGAKVSLFAEVWMKNAFDTHYIPVAFAYGSLAPSGFIGEMGRPRTFGLSGGLTF